MVYIVAISKEHVVVPDYMMKFKMARLNIHGEVLPARIRIKKNRIDWIFKSESDAEKAMIGFCNSRIASARRIR